MNWTQLRRLDLDGGCPSDLLVALTGRVPQLKEFFFGFRHPTRASTWLYPSAEVFNTFSDSIDGLEDVIVTIDGKGGEGFHEICDAFVSKHGPTLQKLRVGYSVTWPGWEVTSVCHLAEDAPVMRDLALKIASVGDWTTIWASESSLVFVHYAMIGEDLLMFSSPKK